MLDLREGVGGVLPAAILDHDRALAFEKRDADQPLAALRFLVLQIDPEPAGDGGEQDEEPRDIRKPAAGCFPGRCLFLRGLGKRDPRRGGHHAHDDGARRRGE